MKKRSIIAVSYTHLDVYKRQQPTHRHYPVAEYITPDQFKQYRTIGLKKGFREVESAPLVLSLIHI